MKKISQEFSNYLKENNLLDAFIFNTNKYKYYELDLINFINNNWDSANLIANENNLKMTFIGIHSENYLFDNRKEVSLKDANTRLLTIIAASLIRVTNGPTNNLVPTEYLILAAIGMRSIGIYDIENLIFPRKWEDEGIANFSDSFQNIQWSEKYIFTKIQAIYFLLTVFEEKSKVEIFKYI